MKRLLSLLLALLLLSGCAVRTPETVRADLSFGEMRDSGLDAALECARAKALLLRIERGEISVREAQTLLDAHREALERLSTDAALAYVRYCFDVTNAENRAAYDALYECVGTLRATLETAAQKLSEGASKRERDDGTDAIGPLLRQERELVGQYEGLSATLSVEYGGRRRTGDEILSDPTLSEEEFTALYEAYAALFHAEASRIFLALVDVRNAIASARGFDSYSDYAYASLRADGSPADAQAFSERVRTAFAPLLKEWNADYVRAAVQLYGMAFPKEATISRVGEAIVSILPDLEEPWDYMVTHGLYDFGSDSTRMPGSFTTYFASYGAPFLFGEWTGGSDMPPLIAHAFGQFASLFRNGDVNNYGKRADLAEFDAQGLELLTVLRYDKLYGDLREAAETAELFYAVYALLAGCMADAFERFAYGQSGVTAEALDEAYARLLDEYGLFAIRSDPRSWTQIAQVFQTPFRGAAYAAGTAAALELYLIGRKDERRAAEAYRTVLSRKAEARFSETLKAAGLRDPFEAGTIEMTAYGLGNVRRNRKSK